MRTRSRILTLILVLGLSPSAISHADGRISAEAGGGLSRVMGAGSLFNTSTSTLGTGTGLNASALVQLTPVNSRVRVFVGLTHRYVTGSDAGVSLGVQGLFPMMRFAFPGLFIGIGWTDHIWVKNPGTGKDGWQRAFEAHGVVSEAGIEYGLSPEASLTATATALWVNQGGVTSPSPSADVTLGIRIYFFPLRPGEGAGGGNPSNYSNGWRYPFGLPKN